MNARVRWVLRIFALTFGGTLAYTIFVYILVYGISFQNERKIFYETLLYSNIITFPAYAIFERLMPAVSKWRTAVQWTIFVVTMTAISSVGSVIGSLILLELNLEPGVPFGRLLWVSFRICVFLGLVVGVVIAIFERMKDRLEKTTLKLRTEELERERAVKLATQARLSSLEARLHPHFLFNTLNSISSLIPADPERAERLVEGMAALLRFSLDSHRGGLVPLEREMQVVRDYLEIEQTRLGGRLRYRIDADNTLLDLGVPPLSIQTLVENSIKYAVAPNREGGEIRVNANRNQGKLRIDVMDSGPGFVMQAATAGHGLDNLKGRLSVLFGEAAEFTVDRREGWTVVSLEMPI